MWRDRGQGSFEDGKRLLVSGYYIMLIPGLVLFAFAGIVGLTK
jgi:hypothetical protein